MALPTGYTEVQYIQSSGTQYVDTGVSSPIGFYISCRVELLSLPNSLQILFGSHDPSMPYNRNFLGAENTNKWQLGAFNAISFGSLSTDTPYLIDVCTISNAVVCAIDGVPQTIDTTVITSPNRSPLPIYLFGLNYSGGLLGSNIKLYTLKLYTDSNKDVLIRDYIPCINPDGEAGLYDTVNSKFYGNAGTGVFFAGPPRVSLPSGYKQLEYIQGTGTQYLNTDVKPNQNTRLIADFEVLSWPSSQFLGARTGVCNTAFNIFVSNATSGRDDWNTSAINFTSENARWKIDKNKNVTAIDSSVITHATGSFSCPVPIYLFAVNNNGSLMATGCAGAKCYSCQIYDNTTLIRDYIPCMNPVGAIGLYDLVNSKFYANAGTGVFTAGPEVTWPSNDAIYVKVNGIWKQIDGIKLL